MVDLQLEGIVEILIRLILWFLFYWLDDAAPFIRKIQPNEVWMYQYPVTESYVPSRDLWIIVLLLPGLFLVTEYFVKHKADDVMRAIKALSLGMGLNGFLTVILKNMVGRPRPDFVYRCFPDGSGTDFTKCTGELSKVMNGRKSFPSGHSSLSFSSLAFLSLYIARKVDICDRSNGGLAWKICACLIPLLVATSIAISRTCDYHHHYEDVIAGSLLGSSVAIATFWLYFPSSNGGGNGISTMKIVQ